ncbi:histone deacetylase domain-containing protein, partial [Baffinella frigidus]
PAGHHAGPRGASACFMEKESQSASHGFCLLSNAAIGAAHAMAARGRDMGVKRVAIVDFDVHHGNGTEECVRNLQPARLTHKVNTPVGELAVKSWDYKPWVTDKDSDNVLFASTHSFGEVSSRNNSGRCDSFQQRPFLTSIPGPRSEDAPVSTRSQREACSLNSTPGASSPNPNRTPSTRNPQQDKMNYGLVALTEDDYAWVTERLRAVAESCCQGRIVSLLEGGYNVTGLTPPSHPLSLSPSLLRGTPSQSCCRSRVSHLLLRAHGYRPHPKL